MVVFIMSFARQQHFLWHPLLFIGLGFFEEPFSFSRTVHGRCTCGHVGHLVI